MDGNQGNHSFLEQRFDVIHGSAFGNTTTLKQGIQSLLEQNDLAEAEMALDHLQEDIIAPFEKNERENLL